MRKKFLWFLALILFARQESGAWLKPIEWTIGFRDERFEYFLLHHQKNQADKEIQRRRKTHLKFLRAQNIDQLHKQNRSAQNHIHLMSLPQKWDQFYPPLGWKVYFLQGIFD